MQQPTDPYPATSPFPLTLSVEYPDRKLNRLSSAFRFLWIIPIGIIVGLLAWGFDYQGSGSSWSWTVTGFLGVPTLLMLLFRRKYPRWWFDWNLNLAKFVVRYESYCMLLRDEYPSTDEEQAAFIDFPYPDAMQLNRWLPLVKWLLAIPHYFVLFFLWIGLVSVRDHRLVRHPVHRPVPSRALRLRRRCQPLDLARAGIRVHPGDRPVSAVQPELDGLSLPL